MAKKNQTKDNTYEIVNSHYQEWSEDNDLRLSRKGGWNDVTKAYWGELPDDWPYMSRVSDPRIRTSILEKDARLLNKKPKGKVLPRGGAANSVKARVQDTVISFQWDNATHGGTMQEKLLISSQDTRLYGSKFAYVYWRVERDDNGDIVFEGNEFEPLDIRDCGMDAKATHIRDAKWFQHRNWYYLDDLEAENDAANKDLWKNLKKIRTKISSGKYKTSDRRDNVRVSQVRSLQGLTDRVGEDRAFPVVEIVTEYRRDRVIAFAPKYGEIVMDEENPFKHGNIPISQLRYYPIQDDPLGESEVAPVLGLWKAIQATICGYLDEMILKMRPPLKIIENSVRIETIEYGPEAQWLMDDPDAVTEMRSTGEAQRWFQTTYSALVSALNTAMGDMSQGVSSMEMFAGEKTATEVKQSAKQQNARDQRNQNELNDFIKDIILMWISNNRQFMFSDKEQTYKMLKLAGIDEYEDLQNMGLSDMELTDDSIEMIRNILDQTDNQIDQGELSEIIDAAKTPKHPFVVNPEEKDLTKLDIKPKLSIEDGANEASLFVEPTDFDGDYDFVVDVKSMEMGSGAELVQTRQQALALLQNKQTLTMLQQEGYRPKIKDLIVSILNEGGLNDSQKYFAKIQEGGAAQGVNPQQGAPHSQQDARVQGAPTPNPQAGIL